MLPPTGQATYSKPAHREGSSSYLGVQLGKLLVIQQALGVHTPLVAELEEGSKGKKRQAARNHTSAPAQSEISLDTEISTSAFPSSSRRRTVTWKHDENQPNENKMYLFSKNPTSLSHTHTQSKAQMKRPSCSSRKHSRSLQWKEVLQPGSRQEAAGEAGLENDRLKHWSWTWWNDMRQSACY